MKHFTDLPTQEEIDRATMKDNGKGPAVIGVALAFYGAIMGITIAIVLLLAAIGG